MFLLWGFIFFDIVYFFKFYKVIFCVKINDIYILKMMCVKNKINMYIYIYYE